MMMICGNGVSEGDLALDLFLAAEEARARVECETAQCVAALNDYFRERRRPFMGAMPVDTSTLESCVSEYVRTLKDLRCAPEVAVRIVKDLIAGGNGHPDDVRVLTNAAVVSAIRSYYGSESAG